MNVSAKTSTMVNCWASPLGGCGGKISREHLVSRALFIGDHIAVQGFPWCKNEPKTIGLANVTAKILCRKHNSDLSDLDSAAAKFFDAIRQATRICNVRSKLKPGIWHVKRFAVDGLKLERWFLKTLINLAWTAKHPIGPQSEMIGVPSADLVEIAFGLKQFERGAGLYTVAHVGQLIHSNDTVQFAPMIKDDLYIAGGLFVFRGFRFLFILVSKQISRLPLGIGLPGENWGASQLNFHNREMRGTVGKYLSHIIKIKW